MTRTFVLKPYLFEGHQLRISRDCHGEVWFVATDVCQALALQPIARVLKALNDDDHGVHCEEGPGQTGLTLALINESGLLRLLLQRSDNTNGRRLRRWLNTELLPALQEQRSRGGHDWHLSPSDEGKEGDQILWDPAVSALLAEEP